MDITTELTDEQILASLILKRDKLNVQLSRVNAAIKAYESDVNVGIYADKQEVNKRNANSKKYPDLVTFTEKILFYVEETNGGFVNDIVEYIMKNEPNKYEEDYLHHRVTQTASSLFGKNRLDADRIGRKFFYKHKKAD